MNPTRPTGGGGGGEGLLRQRALIAAARLREASRWDPAHDAGRDTCFCIVTTVLFSVPQKPGRDGDKIGS